MKKTILLLTLAALAAAQQSRQEKVSPSPNPVDDTKANSDKIPDVYTQSGQFERVVVFRCKFDTDLLADLEKAIAKEKIKNAVILAAMGSVRGYQVHQVSNRDFPSKDMFVKDPTAPADITGMSGYVINGRLHPHITLAIPDHAFGGHLEPGTHVFTFAVVTMGVMKDGVDFTHLDDKTYR